MKKMIFIALLPMFGACKGQAENKQRSETEQTQVSPQIANTDKLITVDVTRDYPEKEIRLQDIADVEYIPLETTNVVLLNNHVHNIRYVSDTLIVAASPTDGYCHFFDGKGRVRSSFTHKGPGGNEYSAMGDVLVDGRNQEIFISDYGLKYRILVYSFEGKYKRTLPLPSQMFWNCPHDYSAEHILCNDSHIESKNPRTQPYVLLSKQTGKISEALPLSFETAYQTGCF